MTREEAADRLRVSITTIARLLHDGELRGIRIGKSIRIRTEDLDRMIAGLPPLPVPADLAAEDEGTWPPTPSLLAQLDGREHTDAQADDDAAAVRAATHRPGHP